MKKAILMPAMLLVLLTVLIGACKSSPASSSASASSAPRESGLYPKFVNEVVGKNAPADVLVGIGNAKMANLSQSRTMAQTRARPEISRQLNAISQEMIRDYLSGAEGTADTLNYQESFTMQLSKSTITGARIVVEDRDTDGQVWCVVYLGENDVAREINQAAAAAKLRAPQAASIDAQERMEAAFEKIAAEEAAKN